MEVFDDRSIEENEANFFAAELLLEDGKVLECLSEHTFFETAKMLYVPAALLDYKFRDQKISYKDDFDLPDDKPV